MSKIVSDPRIDPRIKALMGMMPSGPQSDIANRDDLLAEVNTPDALGDAGRHDGGARHARQRGGRAVDRV